ncbi:MAG: DNA translocase FtsK 4TM domain-containing protein [Alphaproteobacteria bacterium]|nr:DNA translocase FtsK 4TM domain-containing protein [Alphaproteobacteria bacterium]
MQDAWGLTLCGAGAFTIASLLSYTPSDPSFNNTNAGAPFNTGGIAGAYLADAVIQAIGLAGIVPAAVAIVRGVMVLRRSETVFSTGARVLMLACATVLASVALARIPAPAMWAPLAYLGGVTGTGLLSGIANLLQGAIGGAAFTATAAVAAMASTVLAALSIGLPAYSWGDIGRLALSCTAYAAMGIANAWQHARGWFENTDEDDSEIKKPRRATTAERMRKTPKVESTEEDTDEESEEDGDDDMPTLRAVRPSNDAIINKPKKKEKSQHQSALALRSDDSDWEFPDIEILQEAPDEDESDDLDERALKKNAELLSKVLDDYGISGEIVRINPGPVVTLYELEPSPGTKSSRVIGLSDDIARSMSAVSVRAAVVPGRNVIGIEIPNKKRRKVYMRSLLSTEAYANSTYRLPLALGKDIGGEPVVAELAKMPHLLVAGTTGSGKSVAVNTMITSLLYKLSPEQCRFIMIDPKMLELSIYDDIPHLLCPVVTEPGKAIVALKWTVHEMEERYRAMSKLGVRNIDGYNARIREAQQKGEVLTRKIQTGFDPETGKPVYEEQPIELIELPFIVVVVDEFADLMLVAGKEVENAVQRLAQMARAAGIHLIMATQRPSVDVITGIIKANFPTRISFQVTSKIDSRTILNEGGAEQLLGMGDMLYMATGGKIQRVHGPFVSDDEVREIVEHLKAQGEPQYLESITQGGDDEGGEEGTGDMFGGTGSGDDLYDQAVALVAREGKASTSFLQRHLQIGYNRAATLIEKMEKQGVVSPANHVGKRDVLVGER